MKSFNLKKPVCVLMDPQNSVVSISKDVQLEVLTEVFGRLKGGSMR